MDEPLQELSEEYRARCQAEGLYWKGSFDEYLKIVRKNPWVAENAFQRLLRMIESFGKKEKQIGKDKKAVVYGIFEDPISGGADAIFGLDESLAFLVNVLRSAALGHGPQNRIILLDGPVGSSKSTIVRLFKKGLEIFTATQEGAVYTFGWKKEVLGSHLAKLEPEDDDYVLCPLHEDPLHLIPLEIREKFIAKFMAEVDPAVQSAFGEKRNIAIEGDLCPFCRGFFRKLIRVYHGNFAELIREKVAVFRFLFSERDRIGIGTFQPKDEKNQDATELTGDVNFRKIAVVGKDSDPRAFNFDGEFQVGNRGVVEFIEMLKLDVAFLYDLLGVAQEHKIKPKKIAEMDVDLVVIGHTNEPELKKLQNNEFMEALRDRTIKIRIPYILQASQETEVYKKYFNPRTVNNRHIAPHTLQMAAIWAVLTRLEDPKLAHVTRMDKLNLYDGKRLRDFTDETAKELKESAPNEGMSGVSPRYVQDRISSVLVEQTEGCINPFMVMKALENGLQNSALITDGKKREEYIQQMVEARKHFEEIVKMEVQEAISADPKELERLASNYIENVKAYTQKGKIKNTYTGILDPPDEKLMRSVEERMGIPDSRKDDARREMMGFIGARAIESKEFCYDSNPKLLEALKKKLFADKKDFINLGSLNSKVMDGEAQKKIDIVKARLIERYGYCSRCAADVLSYVSSIFARGDAK